MNNGPAGEIDLDLFDDPTDTGDDDSGHSGASERNLEDFYNSSGLSPASIEFSLVDVDDEEGGGCTPWTDQEFAAAALSGLPDPRKGARGASVQPLTRVTEEDFPPGPQRKAFTLVRHFAHQLCTKKTESMDRALAARWLFSNIGKDEVGFDLCCRVLTARADVVRLRLMYELWNRWILFDNPLPRGVVPVPEVLFDEIQTIGGLPGHNLAQIAWVWPGIPTGSLLMESAGRETLEEVPETYTQALEALKRRYLISEKEGGWWLTGRNPQLEMHDGQILHSQPTFRGKSVTFSELFD